jgi:Glyoxalase-like domain
MAIARFKDLCFDANEASRLGAFWAAVLDRRWEPDESGEGQVVGATPAHGVWINRVPEAKTVKNRVHVDVHAQSLADLQALGATVVRAQGDDRTWTVLADPEGNEFCAFLRAELPPDRMHGLVVDCADAGSLARWWGEVYAAPVVYDDRGFATVEQVPGMPILTMDFLPVPERKTVKNRIHWDVSVDDLAPLIERGATVLRAADDEIRWHVLADPEGNEFCAFVSA